MNSKTFGRNLTQQELHRQDNFGVTYISLFTISSVKRLINAKELLKKID